MTKYYWFLLLLPFLLVGGAKTCIAQTQEMVQLIVHTTQPSSDKQTESHKASFAVYDVTKSFYQLRKKDLLSKKHNKSLRDKVLQRVLF